MNSIAILASLNPSTLCPSVSSEALQNHSWYPTGTELLRIETLYASLLLDRKSGAAAIPKANSNRFQRLVVEAFEGSFNDLSPWAKP